jgi:alpha-L-fucosidase
MNKIHKTFLLFIVTTIVYLGQSNKNNIVIIDPSDTPEQIIAKAANVIPSPRQYDWQKLELTGFIHFGINTFNEVEWGQSFTNITLFNPEKIDVKQWVSVFKDAGFKLIILTTKHHDGFCLWPTKYTDYNISNTPFQNGKGDIVRDLSNACREAGIKFGVYLSPWDMHEKSYGTPEYNIYFMNQLTELLTNYGEISEVWFDGACGEGPNGKKQVYDWNAYYKLIRELQPNAVIAVSGPDVRWVGTESGYGRQTEWSVLPGSNLDQNAIAENSQQQSLDGAFTPRDLMDEDLGSREKLKDATSLVWYPAEIDVSIRPRWFFHQGDDKLVKSPQKLVDIYYNSVGLNGVLLLNIPPTNED